MIVHRVPLIENVKIDQNLGIIQSRNHVIAAGGGK